MNRRFISVLLLLSTHLLQAQYTLTGRVEDSLKQPINGAVVRIEISGRVSNVLTNTMGFFQFNDMMAGRYLMKVSSTGYRYYTSDSINVPSGSALLIVLQTDEVTMKEVIVMALKPVIEQLVDRTVMNIDGRLLKEVSRGLDILKLAPGVLVGDNEDEITLSGKDAVQILLNGKLVHLSVRDILKLLKATPAAGLAKVDIITNPSSNYDVKGNTGILNIWIKKTGNAGFNGNVDAGISSGKFRMGDLSNSLTYGKNKLNVQSYLAYHFGKYRNTLSEDRYSPQQSTHSQDIDQWSDPVWRIQADYALNEKHMLGALVEMEKSSNHQYYNADIVSINNTGDTTYIIDNTSPSTRKWNTYNLNYQFKDTNNHELAIDIDRSFYNKEMSSILKNKLTAPFYEKIFGDGYTHTTTTIDIITGKADYSTIMKASKIKIETGVKLSYVSISNDYRVQRMDGTQLKTDSTLTNKFAYTENVKAVYGTISKSYKKWGWKLGLRLEASSVSGISKDLYQQKINRPDTSYINTLPSFFISYTPVAIHSFRLSFTKRVARPDYEDLRPFQYYQNPFFVEAGNPSLAPQINYNTELAYILKSKTTFSASYNHTSNYFTSVNYGVGNIVYETVQNAGIARDFTFSVNYPQRICKWWNSTWRTNIFNNGFDGQVYSDYVHANKWGWNASTSQRFSLPKQWMITLTARYNSAFRRLIYKVGSNAAIGLSVNRNFNNDKGNIRLGASDIFNMQKRNISINTSTVMYMQYNRWESQRVFIDVSFRFGNKKKAAIRDRETSNSDERQRSGN